MARLIRLVLPFLPRPSSLTRIHLPLEAATSSSRSTYTTSKGGVPSRPRSRRLSLAARNKTILSLTMQRLDRSHIRNSRRSRAGTAMSMRSFMTICRLGLLAQASSEHTLSGTRGTCGSSSGYCGACLLGTLGLHDRLLNFSKSVTGTLFFAASTTLLTSIDPE